MFILALPVVIISLWASSVWPLAISSSVGSGTNGTNTSNLHLPVIDLGYTLQRATDYNVNFLPSKTCIAELIRPLGLR